MDNALIVGATSAMATAVARRLAATGASLALLARNADRLDTLAADLEVRGAARVSRHTFDALAPDEHAAAIEAAFDALGQVDLALVCHGSLPDQQACQDDAGTALRELAINGGSAVGVLTHIASRMERQGSGTIAAITSVAGDRGRQSNYLYGAAKGMVSRFLQGLRNRLYASGVNVIDIKPGFVDTPMTAEFDKGPLWAAPDKVAADIIRAVEKGRHTVYTPWFWRYIMLVIRAIPDPVFRRLKL